MGRVQAGPTLAPVSLFRAASTVSLLTLASRVTGLIRELLIASAFGASALTDAFNVAFRIPNLFRRFFAEGAFSQAFVPALAASREQVGDAQTRIVVDRVATVMVWALLAVSLLGVAGAPVLVWALASGLAGPGGAFDAAVWMTRWMFPYIAFMSLVALAAGVLNTWKRFAIPAATPLLLNLCMITAAWLGAPYFATRGIEPIYAMAFGVLAGGALQLALQIPALHAIGMLPRPSFSTTQLRAALADPACRRIGQVMVPALIAAGVAPISLVINTQIASHLAAGSVSWVTYADRLMEFPSALLGVALGVVLLPQLSAARARGDAAQFSAMLDWGLRLVLLLATPCAIALLVFAQPLVATLFHHGAFSAEDVRQTARALMGWGVGLVGLIAVKVLAPAYFAQQDTRTPMRIALVVLVVTQVFNALLVGSLAHAALTLSIALAALVNALWLLVGLMRSRRYVPQAGWGPFGLQVLAANALMVIWLIWVEGAGAWIQWGADGQSLRRIAAMAGTLLVAAVIYFGALLAAGVNLRALVRR